MGQTIQADREHPSVPLSMLVTRDGGITGLTIAAKIFDGGDLTTWLDFDDGTFKAAGHTTPTLDVAEVDATEAPGMYAVDGGFDLSAITIPAATLTLLVHYDITAGGESGNDVDTIQFQDRVVDLVWDERNRGSDHNLQNSTGRQLRQASGGFESKDVASATLTTLVLDATESAVNDFLTHRHIAIVDGLGSGQVRVIDSYDGTTKIATVSRPWDVVPDATSDYLLLLSSESTLTALERTAINTTLSGAHGAGSWLSATGFSTHSAADVDTVLSANHGAGSWLSATGFSTHSAADVDTLLSANHGAGSWIGVALTAAQAIQLQETWTALGANIAAPASYDAIGLFVRALANPTPIDIAISVVGSTVTLTRQP